MDSDSDDDSILGEAVFRRRPKRATGKEKAAERAKAHKNSLLDSALQSADRSAEQRHRLSQMQSESSESMIQDEELKRRVAEATESARKKPKFSVAQIANGLGDHIDDGAHDKTVKKRIVEAIDTKGTVNHGLRPTINLPSMIALHRNAMNVEQRNQQCLNRSKIPNCLPLLRGPRSILSGGRVCDYTPTKVRNISTLLPA